MVDMNLLCILYYSGAGALHRVARRCRRLAYSIRFALTVEGLERFLVDGDVDPAPDPLDKSVYPQVHTSGVRLIFHNCEDRGSHNVQGCNAGR